MQPRVTWTEMRWDFDTPASRWPLVLERLRGTPARCLGLIARLNEPQLKARPDDQNWSILEHVGHLAVIEPLWLGRLDDFAAGLDRLREADMSNQATWAANINDAPPVQILKGQGDARRALMDRLENWGDTQAWEQAATHPRLNTPMRVIDLAVFVADHDDYHMAQIHERTMALASGLK